MNRRKQIEQLRATSNNSSWLEAEALQEENS